MSPWAKGVGGVLPPQPCYASNLDANPKNPDVVRLLGFFIPIFHSANLVDANG